MGTRRRRDQIEDPAALLAEGEVVGLASLAKPHAVRAMKTLADATKGAKVPWPTKVSAAKTVLEMAYHRPSAAPLTGGDQGNITVNIINPMIGGPAESFELYSHHPQVELTRGEGGAYAPPHTPEVSDEGNEGPLRDERVGGASNRQGEGTDGPQAGGHVDGPDGDSGDARVVIRHFGLEPD